MDPYLNKQIFIIDSHNRTSGTHNDFHAEVNLKSDKEFDSVVVLRATIKKSFYLVRTGYNTFTVQEGATSRLITIPEGNYSATSFKIVLQDLLNLGSTMGVYTITLPTAQEPSTGKYTFACSGGNPSFIFTNNNIYERMGFEPNSTSTFSGGILVSDNIINFQLEDTLHIHSDMVAGENEKNNILQEVSGYGSDFSSLRYECMDVMANCKKLKDKKNSYHFVILNEDHQPVNLDLNVIFTIMVFKKNTPVNIDNINQTMLMIQDLIRFYMVKDDPSKKKKVILKENKENKDENKK